MAEVSPRTVIKYLTAFGFVAGAGLTAGYKLGEIGEAETADLCGFKIGQVFEGARTGVTCDTDEVEALEELHGLELKTTPTDIEDEMVVETEGVPLDIADQTSGLVRDLKMGLILGDGAADIIKNGAGGAVVGLVLGGLAAASDRQRP